MSEVGAPARSMSRRRFLTLSGRGAAATVVGGLAVNGAVQAVRPKAGASAQAGGDRVLERELRIGYLPLTDATALLLGHDLGLFAQYGVPSARPVLFRSWESLAQAFTVGEVDVVHLLMPFAVQLRFARSVPAKVLGWGHANGSALTVRRGITSLDQLAGGTVAIPYWWSVHNVLLQRMLVAAGLQVGLRGQGAVSGTATSSAGTAGPAPGGRAGRVDLVVMPPAEMASALAAGQLTGFVVADPFSAVAEANGSGTVLRFLGDAWRSHGCCAVVVRDDLIATNPRAVQGIADAVVGAQRWADEHRGAAADRLTGPSEAAGSAGYLPQKTAAVRRVLTRTADQGGVQRRHPDWHGERLEFAAFPYPSATTTLVELMKQTRVDGSTAFLDRLDPSTVHARLVDDRFVRAALSRHAPPVRSPADATPGSTGTTVRTEQVDP